MELARQDEKTLVRWIYGNVKKEGKQITESSIHYVLSKCGTDMENLQKEMEKLFCYTLDKEVIELRDIDAICTTQITNEIFVLSKCGTDMENLQKEMEKLFCYTLDKEVIELRDIDAICTTQITNEIFDMVNAVAEKKQKRALDRYYDLLALKEPAMRILYLLSRQFRLLMEVKEMTGQGYDKKSIASKAGLHPFAVGKYIEQSRRFSQEELRSILEESVDIEERVKTGRLQDVLAVELFIVKYSSNSV